MKKNTVILSFKALLAPFLKETICQRGKNNLLFIIYYLVYSEAFCGSLKIWLMTARTKISPPPLAQQNYNSFHPTRYYKFIFAIIKKCPCIKILHLSIVQGRGNIKKKCKAASEFLLFIHSVQCTWCRNKFAKAYLSNNLLVSDRMGS